MKNISEDQAEETVGDLYKRLKKAFNTTQVPLFFTYLGPFPEYLAYIADQIIGNVQEERFIALHSQVEKDIAQLIRQLLPLSEKRIHWSNRYKNSPSYYHFKKDLQRTYTTNVTLAIIYIALREAIKGWAVAAPQLSSKIVSSSQKGVHIEHKEEEFIMEEYIVSSSFTSHADQERKAIARRDSSHIERNLFIEFINMNREDYFQFLKTEQYLFLRVYVEKILLASIHLLPKPINSPINVVFELASTYKEFPDLLYLLSEHFPTYAVQRMIFSGYLLE